MIEKSLRQWLRPVVNRQKNLFIMKKLSLYWFLAAIFGIAIIAADRLWGWSSPAELGFLLIVTAILTITAFVKSGSIEPDYLKLAREIETHHPDLKATLLTAIEQKPRNFGGELDYLQERVIGEALAHARRHKWVESIPQSRFILAGCANAAALILFVAVLSQFNLPCFSGPQINTINSPKPKGYELTVTPGDTNVELGTSVVILARFDGKVPDTAKLFVGTKIDDLQELTFAKNLEDPVFGGVIQQVGSDMIYRIEYDEKKTQDYVIKTYTHPALERADANIVFPAYTSQPNKEIKDTRTVTVVEGSKVTFTFLFNKPVVTAQLTAKDQPAIDLIINPGELNTYTTLIEPRENQKYELKLVDSDGRANKAPPRFSINVTKNMPPNLKLKFPNRDTEASPLEEMTLQAEISDDYGVTSHGVSYILGGSDEKDIPLGEPIPANKKEPVEYVLAMEKLNVQPDQLLSYYFWAEDTGPDGNVRRTVSDLYFTEIRSFEQIFRENQSFMDQNQQENQQRDQQQQNQQGQGNNQQQREQLVQLQKQIITATWNTKRQIDMTKGGVETKKEDINLIMQSQSDALDIARNGGDQSTGQRGAAGGGRGGQGGQGGRGGRGGRGGMMMPQSGGMNQINPPTPGNETASSADPMEQAIQHMEQAIEHLQETLKTSTSKELSDALAAEQAAYQELLKLREQESQVARDRSGQRGNQNRSARQQQQLQQLEMRQRQDRYEMQSQAQQEDQQQQSQQREDLQVLNRLRDLARRQNEMTDRLREAESALRQAQNEQERQEIQRELERLRQEQIENMRSADELQQRMQNQQNRQQMSDSANQLSQTRERMQQTAEQMQQGQVSEAAANSTRAQRELEQMREEFQRNTSGQFSQQMQNMRQQARELDQNQQQISQEMRQQQQSGSQQDSLGQPGTNQDLANRVQQQRDILEKLLEQMREVSEQSEESEPLLSRRLYDTYRQTSTENIDRSLQNTEELLRRNFRPQAQNTETQARQGIENLRKGIEEAAQSVLGDEADSLRLAREQVDEALKQLRGQGEPNDTENMQAQAGRGGQRGFDPNQMSNMQARGGNRGQRGFDPNQMGNMQARGGNRGQRGFDPNQMGNMQARGGNRGQRGFDPNQMGNMQARGGNRGQRGFDPNQIGNMQARGGNRGQRGFDPNQMGNMQARGGNRGQRGFDPNQLGEMARGMRGGQNFDPNQIAQMLRGMRGMQGIDPNQLAQMAREMTSPGFDPNQLAQMLRNMQAGQGFDPNQMGNMQARGGTRGQRGFDPNESGNMQARGGRGQFDIRQLENQLRTGQANPNGLGGYQPFDAWDIDDPNNPLTGENFRQWFDRLREVEEMLSQQELREQVATVRERARTIREDYTRNSKEPQWDMVEWEVVKPLTEVRERISEELAKLESKEAIVPIDRDPVPARYSDLVRAYYENLGGDN